MKKNEQDRSSTFISNATIDFCKSTNIAFYRQPRLHTRMRATERAVKTVESLNVDNMKERIGFIRIFQIDFRE